MKFGVCYLFSLTGLVATVLLLVGTDPSPKASAAGLQHATTMSLPPTTTIVPIEFHDYLDPLQPKPTVFTDTQGHEYLIPISVLAERDVFEGTECGDGLFCPDDLALRWVVGLWLHRVWTNGEMPMAELIFEDAPTDWSDKWETHVAELYRHGVTKGCSAKPLLFCSENVINRGQLAALIARAYKLEPQRESEFIDIQESIFADDITAVAELGVMANCSVGTQYFCPGQGVTRGEVADALWKVHRHRWIQLTGSVCKIPGGNYGRYASFRNDDTVGFLPSEHSAHLQKGTIKIAMIFGTYASKSVEHSTKDEAAEQTRLWKEYMETSSYGHLEIDVDVFHGWQIVDLPFDPYANRYHHGRHVNIGLADNPHKDFIQATIQQTIKERDVDFAEYDAIAVIAPSTYLSGGLAYGHITYFRYGDDWDNKPIMAVNTFTSYSHRPVWWDVAAHELMHILGVPDLYPYRPRQLHTFQHSYPDSLIQTEFGVMGLAIWYPDDPTQFPIHYEWNGVERTYPDKFHKAQEMLGWVRWQMGWLLDTQVECVQQYPFETSIAPSALATESDTVLAVIPSLRHNYAYVIESRRAIGYDTNENYMVGNDFYTEDKDHFSWRLPEEGVLVYTVRGDTAGGYLPMLVAPDDGSGFVGDNPILGEGDSVIVGDPDTFDGAYLVEVIDSDSTTDTVRVTKIEPSE